MPRLGRAPRVIVADWLCVRTRRAAAKGALNAAADAAKAVETFYYRTHICLSPRQAALMQVEQERAEREKDVAVGMRIINEVRAHRCPSNRGTLCSHPNDHHHLLQLSMSCGTFRLTERSRVVYIAGDRQALRYVFRAPELQLPEVPSDAGAGWCRGKYTSNQRR